MSCCGNCLKIQITDSVIGILPSMKQGGNTYLDLAPGFTLDLSKSVSDIELDEINDEVALEFSVPQTPVNDILARQLTDKNKVSDTSIGYNVIVSEGAVIHKFYRMYFVSGGDATGGYNIRLTQGETHWLPRAQNTFLEEIDFGEVKFDVTTINTLNGRSGYVDGEEGVVFPLVNYGKFSQPFDIVIEDLRPMMFMLKVLKDGFCYIGWNFTCPTLESTPGRKIITYTNSKDFGQNADLLESKKFSAGIDGSFGFTTEIFDNGEVFTAGRFVGNGNHKFTVEVEGTLAGSDDGPVDIVVFIQKSNNQDRIAERLGEGPFKITIEGEYNLQSGDFVFAGIEGNTEFLTITNAVFYNEPLSSTPTRGKIIQLNQLQGRYPFLDYFKGCVHLFNGKIVTDWVNKTVSMYSPYDLEWYDEAIEGFYLNTIRDWTDKIINKSEDPNNDSIDTKRFQLFTFADAKDAHIQKLKLETDKPLYSKRVDLGPDYVEGETSIKNPFFEPTKNDKLADFDFASPVVNNLPIDVPFMLDNTGGELSFNIGPRVLFWNGNSTQTSEDGTITRYFKFEGATSTSVPYAFQVPDSYVDDGQDIKLPDFALDFEGETNGLFAAFYEREFKEGIFAHRFAYQALVGSYEYETTNFRQKYLGYYGGKTFLFRLLEVNNYQTCSNSPIQVITRPELFIGDICNTDINEQIVNEPQIRVKYNPDTDQISAERVSTRIFSPIQTDTFTYSIDNGVTFNPYVDNTPLNDDFIIFRRNVLYSDGSQPDQVEEVANKQKLCKNNPLIEVDINHEANTILAFALDTVESTIDTDVWTVEIDGAATVPYTPNTLISGFTTVLFNRVINYTDHCPEQVLQSAYRAELVECDNRPVLEWNEIADCLYVLQINTTNVDSNIGMTFFQVYNPHTQKWNPWNGSPIRGEDGVKARVRILYQGDCPPSTIEVECPS